MRCGISDGRVGFQQENAAVSHLRRREFLFMINDIQLPLCFTRLIKRLNLRGRAPQRWRV